MKSKILIVDDDKNICKLMDLYLKDAGYETFCCHDGSSAIDCVHSDHYDLVILDLMIPLINGWEVCKLIKMEFEMPIIMVSARDMTDDKVLGFDAGADDYIVKPFDPKELIARVKVRLKAQSSEVSERLARDQKEQEDRQLKHGALSVDNLLVDINRYEVALDGLKVQLKPKEIQLLYFLLQNKNIVFTRDQLLEKIWDYTYSGDTRTVDVHIKCLREKLTSSSPNWEIKTVWGVGYKMEVK